MGISKRNNEQRMEKFRSRRYIQFSSLLFGLEYGKNRGRRGRGQGFRGLRGLGKGPQQLTHTTHDSRLSLLSHLFFM